MAALSAWQSRMIAGRARRMLRFNVRIVKYTNKVLVSTQKTLKARLMVVGQLLRDRTVINISHPVMKEKRIVNERDPETGKVTRKVRTVTVDGPPSRSRPGEYPHADTTRLMKDIFYEWREEQAAVRVGTTLDYGLFLETRMNRSFLVRTLNEMRPWIAQVFSQEGLGAGGSVLTPQFDIPQGWLAGKDPGNALGL
jgi:hypothetical protein